MLYCSLHSATIDTMAILGDKEGVHVEITFTQHSVGWMWGEIRLRYGEKSLLNPEILERDYFTFCEPEPDAKMRLPFEIALKTNESCGWEPMEPDIAIDIVTDSSKDWFDITLSIDPSQLKNKESLPYGYDKPAVCITLDRNELEKFVKQLNLEYSDYVERNREKIEYYGGEKSENSN